VKQGGGEREVRRLQMSGDINLPNTAMVAAANYSGEKFRLAA
jgi:hypothetical protein